MPKPTHTMLDVRIDDLSLGEAVDRAEQMIRSGGFHQVVTPGPEFLLEASQHPKFLKILNQSDLSLPDGMGLWVGSRLIRQPLKHRVPGVDFVLALLERATQRGYSVFLYGGAPGIAERASVALKRTYPKLHIAGFESGYRGWWQRLADHRVIEKIHRAKPDILLVALGAPKQELWIAQHRQALHQVKLAIGIGRTFDYLAGAIQRPPRWVRAGGLEWLWTWLQAGKFHDPRHRRQRVYNATWNFVRTLLHRHYGRS